MHDPMTVAFDFPPYEWGWARKILGRLFTVWHRDPERDGSDDSCGWSRVTLSIADREWCSIEAEREWKFFFNPEWSTTNLATADPHEIVTAAWLQVRTRLGRRWWNKLSADEQADILRLTCNPIDNLRHLALRAKRSPSELGGLFYCLLRYQLTRRRPWWKHPRFHVWHWRIQIHPIQELKRWLFSRCCWCGLRFAWGESPIGYSWHGTGPLWFRSERSVAHGRCDRAHAFKPQGQAS